MEIFETSEITSRLDSMESTLRLLLIQNMMDKCEADAEHLDKINFSPSKFYIFFNCDENKSPQTMNIKYNNIAYEDTPEGRNKLFNRILKEKSEKKIIVNLEDLEAIKDIILTKNPIDAGKYLKYGDIVEVCVG